MIKQTWTSLPCTIVDFCLSGWLLKNKFNHKAKIEINQILIFSQRFHLFILTLNKVKMEISKILILMKLMMKQMKRHMMKL